VSKTLVERDVATTGTRSTARSARGGGPRRLPRFVRSAVLLLLAGCGPLEPYDEAPDLSGRYRLVTWESLEWTEGRTASPPDVKGLLGLVQHRVEEDHALGVVSIELELNRPDGTTLSSRFRDDLYTNDTGGRFVTRSVRSPAPMLSGSYVFEDGVLVTTLVRRAPFRDPPLMANGTIRWEPCGPTWQDCEQDR